MAKNNKALLQIFLVPICLFIGYVFASLIKYNEVNYSTFPEILPSILLNIFMISGCVYIFFSVIFSTPVYEYVRKIIKVFDAAYDYAHTYIYIYIYAAIVFFFMYSLILKQPQDFPTHTYWAVDLFDWRALKDSIVSIPYPLWHILVSLTNKVLWVPALYAAALVTAAFFAWEYVIICKIMISMNNFRNNSNAIKRTAAFSLILMFVQPIYIPWFNSLRFLGQGTPNIWDNPTQAATYPFALLSTYIFIQIFYEENRDITLYDYIHLGLYSFLSVLAKPSFFQIFIPAIAIVMLIRLVKTKGKSFVLSVKVVISFIPAALWCIMIFVLSFISTDTLAASGGNGIDITFLEVWKLYTRNIPISIFIGAMFPIVFFICTKYDFRKKPSMIFIIICWIVGILEFMFLKETGYRMSHANFGWGYRIGITLMFVFAGSEYVSILTNHPKESSATRSMILPTVVFTLNFLFGIEYYVELWCRHIPY